MKNNKKITELVISGGGVRGIAFLAVIYELEQRELLELTKVSGTSIGAFIGACLVIGYTAKELMDKLFYYDLKSLKDIDIQNSLENKSFLKGNKVKRFFESFIEHKIDPCITLYELYHQTGIEYYATTCCLNTKSIEYLSYKTYPDLTLLQCILMSTAIPGILPPVEYSNQLYIDGGLLDNMPTSVLSNNAVSIKSSSKQPHESFCGNNINVLDYCKEIIKMMYSQIKTEHDTQNMIVVDTRDVTVTSFDITIDQKYTLIQMAKQAVDSYTC